MVKRPQKHLVLGELVGDLIGELCIRYAQLHGKTSTPLKFALVSACGATLVGRMRRTEATVCSNAS